jgi:hypothetical protein
MRYRARASLLSLGPASDDRCRFDIVPLAGDTRPRLPLLRRYAEAPAGALLNRPQGRSRSRVAASPSRCERSYGCPIWLTILVHPHNHQGDAPHQAAFSLANAGNCDTALSFKVTVEPLTVYEPPLIKVMDL